LTNTNNVGLFGYIYDAEIWNLGIIDGIVRGYTNVGGVCGRMQGNSRIIACYNEKVHVAAYYWTAGGVCGDASSYNSKIIACYNMANVHSANIYSGGVIGRTWGVVTACYNTGTVTGVGLVGGVCGSLSHAAGDSPMGSMIACYNIGIVTGANNSGGVCGDKAGSVIDCYWFNAGGNAIHGIGQPVVTDGTAPEFGPPPYWPTSTTHVYWRTGIAPDDPEEGPFWQALYTWTGGGDGQQYPKLYFE
jgi:hypothetical protein